MSFVVFSRLTEGDVKLASLCKKRLHRMTRANTYHHPSKGPECRECKRAYMRSYMREVRAAAAARARRRKRRSA